MNRTIELGLICLGLTATAATSLAQYTPAPPRPYPGFINDKLRVSDPYMSAWDIGVNLRGRMEAKDDAGFTSAGSNRDFDANGSGAARDNNNTYFLTRVMPRVGYTDKWYQLFAEGRSSSSFDDERENSALTGPGRGLAENDSDMNLHQGYVFVGNHKEFPASLKLGRQELAYGDQRQVGHLRWNNNARTFDAAKLRYQHSWFGVDVFHGGIVYNDNNNFNRSHIGSDSFSGAYFNFPKLAKNEIVEAYLYNRNVRRDIVNEDFSGVAAPFRNPVIQDLYTAGLRVKSKPNAYGPWDYSAEIMHQFGTINNRTGAGAAIAPLAGSAVILGAPEKDQDAYAAILGVGYTWTESTMQPRLALIYSYASGDSNATDGTSGTFQNQFATTHLHYGYMDLNSLQNLHDIRLAYTFKPTSTLTVALEGHLQYLDKTTDYWYNVGGVARSAGGYAGALTSDSSELGQEIDLVVGWYPALHTHVEVGVSHYFAGEYIEENLERNGTSAKDASYVYVQLTLNL